MKKSVFAALLAALLPLTIAGTSAEAAPVLVTSRAALGAVDSIDWADLSPSWTPVSNTFSITSDNGLGVDVSKASAGDFERRDQGDGWYGNFAPGDAVLSTNFTPGPISLEFDDLVFGGGAQIQSIFLGDFTATIEAFDLAGVSLGLFELAGLSNSDGDNGAIFIGILDSERSIARIEIGLTMGQSFAINRFDIAGAPRQPTPAPEPGTLALIGAGLFGLAVFGRRKPA